MENTVTIPKKKVELSLLNDLTGTYAKVEVEEIYNEDRYEMEILLSEIL